MLLIPKPRNTKSLKNNTATILYVALKIPEKRCTFLVPKHSKSKPGLQCISRQNTDHV